MCNYIYNTIQTDQSCTGPELNLNKTWTEPQHEPNKILIHAIANACLGSVYDQVLFRFCFGSIQKLYNFYVFCTVQKKLKYQRI